MRMWMLAGLFLSGCGPASSSTTPEVSLDLQDRAYWIRLDQAEALEAEGLFDLISFLLTQEVLIGVESATDTTLDFQMGLSIVGSDPPEQDPCAATVPMRSGTLDGTAFSVGPTDAIISPYGDPYTVYDLTIQGDFNADGSEIADAVLVATIDAREVMDAFGMDDPAELCDLIGATGISCSPCPSDGAEVCMTATLQNLWGAAFEDGVQPVSDTEANACNETGGG